MNVVVDSLSILLSAGLIVWAISVISYASSGLDSKQEEITFYAIGTCLIIIALLVNHVFV